MPHHIYQTRAFVTGSFPSGEADKTILLFTEELGLVRGVAKSVRSAKSKLRCSLQDGAFLRVNLVRGKEVWRITDAQEIARFSSISHQKSARVMASIFSLLRRFIHGEGREEQTFHIVENAFSFLQSLQSVQNKSEDKNKNKNENKSAHTEKVFEQDLEEILKNFEILATLRILHSLGYVEEGELGKFFSGDFSREILADFSPYRPAALQHINRAYAESHL